MLGRANCELLTPAIKECRFVSVCPPTARPPPITCTRQPRRAPFSGQLAHSLCATNRNCNASPYGQKIGTASFPCPYRKRHLHRGQRLSLPLMPPGESL